MKRNAMSIYIQDTALESCLEPLEEKLLFLPSQAKCKIFSLTQKSQIKIKLQMLLYMTGTFLPRKENAALINLQCIYTWV